MGRRFITAEDVRRANGEILVDVDTVVTPQALETAESRGVRIRRADGKAYSEPAPDRGPDAARAVHHLPHLPEPDPEIGAGTGFVVTAIGRNRPGILAEITGALAALQASVVDISQRTVDDYFHLVLTVELRGTAGFDETKGCLECLGGPDDFVVRVMHERVFRFMHRI